MKACQAKMQHIFENMHRTHIHKVYEMEGQKTHAHELEKRENRDLPAANNI